MRRVVIIGAGGFIGSHLCEWLLESKEWEIKAWDLASQKIAHLLENPRLQFHHKNAHADATLSRAIEDSDVVISLAAICNPAQYTNRPLAVIHSNFIEAYQLVDLCATHKRWLFHFSTSEVYGRTLGSYSAKEVVETEEYSESNSPLVLGPIHQQRWCYASAKQLLERYIYAHHSENGLPYTIIRPFNFFGPRMDFLPGQDGEGIPRVWACFAEALLKGKPLQLVEGGEARRTFLYIDDAIRAVLLLLDKPDAAQNQIFNVGNRKTELRIHELAELMKSCMSELRAEKKYLNHPCEVVSGKDFYGEGYEDSDRRMPNMKKLEALGWKPISEFRPMIKKTLQYYMNKYDHRQDL